MDNHVCVRVRDGERPVVSYNYPERLPTEPFFMVYHPCPCGRQVHVEAVTLRDYQRYIARQGVQEHEVNRLPFYDYNNNDYAMNDENNEDEESFENPENDEDPENEPHQLVEPDGDWLNGPNPENALLANLQLLSTLASERDHFKGIFYDSDDEAER